MTPRLFLDLLSSGTLDRAGDAASHDPKAIGGIDDRFDRRFENAAPDYLNLQ
jgi:hypothetical protein